MTRIILIVTLAAAAMSWAGDEKQLSINEIPAVVKAVFENSYPKAVIEAVTEETEDSVTYYEITSKEGEVIRDVLYRTDGTVVVVETTIPASELPAAVSKSLHAKYPKAKIEKTETLLKNGVTSYEVLLKSGENYYEVALTADGTITDTEDKGETLEDD